MDYIITGVLLVLCSSWPFQPVSSFSPPLRLTPYIHNNKTTEARNLSLVDPALFLNKTSHSGFLTIDPRFDSNTFFWYFPVETKPNETEPRPWIVWLQGGPGASSLVGLFDEIGPFEYVEGELKARKNAWTDKYSVLFLDNPVGAGYSFTNSTEGYAKNMSMYSNHLYSALQQFLTIFPELRKAPLFIAGESYAGRYVPALGMRILEDTQLTEEWQITLEGLIMGNPVLNREDVANQTAAFYQLGLIDYQGVLATKILQDSYSKAIEMGNNKLAYDVHNHLLDKLMDMALLQHTYNPLVDEYHVDGFKEYLGREDVRQAMHVGQLRFMFDNSTVTKMLIPDFLSNVQEKIEKLLEKYKILIYCGQLDLTAPCVPNAEARRRKWHWSRKDEFLNAPRVPWWYNESVAGYVKSGGGFTEALIRGAGHLVPIDRPAQALALVSNFIRNVEMELPPNYQPGDDVTPLLDSLDSTTTPSSTSKAVNVTIKPNTDGAAKENSTREPPKNSSQILPPVLPKIQETSEPKASGPSPGTIVSVVLNVVLVLIIMAGAFLYYRLKRRNEDFFYNQVENTSDDLFLT